MIEILSPHLKTRLQPAMVASAEPTRIGALLAVIDRCGKPLIRTSNPRSAFSATRESRNHELIHAAFSVGPRE